MINPRIVMELPSWLFLCFVFFGFCFLYFGSAFAALWLSRKAFPAMGLGGAIGGSLRKGQLKTEIGYSLVSIAVFAFIGWATRWMVQRGWLSISWEIDWLSLGIEIAVLFLWNEIHFYVCHRLLHTRWLYRRVHIVHHRSTAPTPFSTYSFHWAEALMLGSVMATALAFYEFQYLALASLPLASISLNALGHFNYDPFPDKPASHPLAFSRRHSLHHSRNAGNYGFSLSVFDWAFKTAIKERSKNKQEEDKP